MKSILTSHFVQSTLPKYIEEMLMNCLTNLSNDQNIMQSFDSICELIKLCRNVCSKLQTEKQLIVILNNLQKLIYETKDIEQNNIYLLDKQELYFFQIVLRIICLMIQFETKQNKDLIFEKYSIDFEKMLLYLKTTQYYQLDQRINDICLQLECKSIIFCKKLIKILKQFSLTKSIKTIKSYKINLQQKLFQKLRDKKGNLEIQKQESKGDCSNSYFDQFEFRIKDKRLSMIMNVKQLKQEQYHTTFHEALKQKENVKLINTIESTVNRPTLNKRTINDGINGKYKVHDKQQILKLGDQIKMKKRVSSNMKKKMNTEQVKPFQLLEEQQQLDFCKEVSRKLLQLQQSKKRIAWDSEFLALETDSNSD